MKRILTMWMWWALPGPGFDVNLNSSSAFEFKIISTITKPCYWSSLHSHHQWSVWLEVIWDLAFHVISVWLFGLHHSPKDSFHTSLTHISHFYFILVLCNYTNTCIISYTHCIISCTVYPYYNLLMLNYTYFTILVYIFCPVQLYLFLHRVTITCFDLCNVSYQSHLYIKAV